MPYETPGVYFIFREIINTSFPVLHLNASLRRVAAVLVKPKHFLYKPQISTRIFVAWSCKSVLWLCSCGVVLL